MPRRISVFVSRPLGRDAARIRGHHGDYRVETDAPDDKVDELCTYVRRTSPVMDIIRNPVPVTVRRTA